MSSEIDIRVYSKIASFKVEAMFCHLVDCVSIWQPLFDGRWSDVTIRSEAPFNVIRKREGPLTTLQSKEFIHSEKLPNKCYLAANIPFSRWRFVEGRAVKENPYLTVWAQDSDCPMDNRGTDETEGHGRLVVPNSGRYLAVMDTVNMDEHPWNKAVAENLKHLGNLALSLGSDISVASVKLFADHGHFWPINAHWVRYSSHAEVVMVQPELEDRQVRVSG